MKCKFFITYLSRQLEEQRKELCDLRRKYAVKIILACCNKANKDFEMGTHGFRTLQLEEKNQLEAEAFKKIKRRAKEMMN